jgi:acyl carrier protein
MNEKLLAIFAKVFHLQPENIDPALMSMKTFQPWSSLKHINLVLALEQEFQTFFAPEEMQAMTSFAAIVALLEKKGIRE